MSSSLLFAPVFRSTDRQVPATHKKRKRGQSDQSSASQDDTAGLGIIQSAPDAIKTSPRPDQVVQYQVTDQLYNGDLPGPGFPHKAVKTAIDNPPTDLEDGGALSSTTRVTRTVPVQSRLRRRHVAVLTAVLHRCMLEEDYIRAGRAWGMLLRVDLDGHCLDLRNHGTWGLGAEILMFRDGQLNNSQAQGSQGYQEKLIDETISSDGPAERRAVSLFSRHGFVKAKDYYERLILQYPYRKSVPNAVSSLDFYPAMFSLWIYAVQEQGKATSSGAQQAYRDRLVPGQDAEIHSNIRIHALQQASEINSRLDEILVSPPYSDDARLWKIRGMVALWEADLIQSLTATSPNPAALPTNEPYASESLHSQRTAARLKAKQAFETLSGLGDVSILGHPMVSQIRQA